MSQRRILVLQLCRLGDLIQTTPMLRAVAGVAAGRPRHACRDSMASRTRRFRGVSTTISLAFPFGPVTALTGAVPSRWQEALREVRAFVRGAGLEPYDQIVNVTGSALSNLLATVIPSRDVQGGIIVADRTRVVRGPWMTSLLGEHRGPRPGVLQRRGCHDAIRGPPTRRARTRN